MPPSAATSQYPLPSCVVAMPTMGALSADGARAPVEAGVAVGEDAAVGGHEPVALAVGRRRHADDRLVQVRRRPWSRRTGRRRRRTRRRRARRASTPWRRAWWPWRRSVPAAARRPRSPRRWRRRRRRRRRPRWPAGSRCRRAWPTPEKTGELSGWGMSGAVGLDAAEADHAAVVVDVRPRGRAGRDAAAAEREHRRCDQRGDGDDRQTRRPSAASGGARSLSSPAPPGPPSAHDSSILHAALRAATGTWRLRSRYELPVQRGCRPDRVAGRSRRTPVGGSTRTHGRMGA